MNDSAVLVMGTFNPITNAHINMGKVAYEYFNSNNEDVDIIYIPNNFSFISNWKYIDKEDKIFTNESRLKLLHEVLDSNSNFIINIVESTQVVDGKTYNTVDYMKYLGYKNIYIAMGTDKLPELEKWYRINDILSENKILLFDRGEDTLDSLNIPFLKSYRDRFIEFNSNNNLKYVSSSNVRDAFYNNKLDNVKDAIPIEVYNYLLSKSNFNVEEITEDLILWIREWFNNNGKDCNAVIGISGGKDSTITAALCVRALGKDRVIGVMMPNGIQSDIADSIKVCEILGIENYTININDATTALLNQITCNNIDITRQSRDNLPPRIRMSALYAVSQCRNGRVINTCNLSENFIGYFTKYGDGTGDMSPLANFTVTEVKAIGKYLGLPTELIEKVPADGLCGKTDEDNLGFSYDILDKYIRNHICDDDNIKTIIYNRHRANSFKMRSMDSYPYSTSYCV